MVWFLVSNVLIWIMVKILAFFIVCGDLVDAFPEKFPEIRDQQTRDLLNIYSKLDKSIPLVCVCGNHDIGNGGFEIEAGLFYLSWSWCMMCKHEVIKNKRPHVSWHLKTENKTSTNLVDLERGQNFGIKASSGFGFRARVGLLKTGHSGSEFTCHLHHFVWLNFGLVWKSGPGFWLIQHRPRVDPRPVCSGLGSFQLKILGVVRIHILPIF